MPQQRQHAAGLRLGRAVANRAQAVGHAEDHGRWVRRAVLLAVLVSSNLGAQDSAAVRAGDQDGRRAARAVSTRGAFTVGG